MPLSLFWKTSPSLLNFSPRFHSNEVLIYFDIYFSSSIFALNFSFLPQTLVHHDSPSKFSLLQPHIPPNSLFPVSPHHSHFFPYSAAPFDTPMTVSSNQAFYQNFKHLTSLTNPTPHMTLSFFFLLHFISISFPLDRAATCFVLCVNYGGQRDRERVKRIVNWPTPERDRFHSAYK